MVGTGSHHASIMDVAARAGVSPSTVSRSLRGLPHVSDFTRAKVLRAAHELHYVASPTATRLATGRTGAVGVVVPYATRWFFTHVVTGAERVLREAGYDLLLWTLGDDRGRERFFAQLPVARRVDALLVVSLPLTAAERDRLLRLRQPTVLVGARADGLPSIRIDDAAGAARAARHLLHLGHTRIGMLCGEQPDGLDFTAPGQRRAGFLQALAQAGHPAADEHVVAAPWGLEGGARAMEQLLSGDRLPSAVFAESDEMAFGALRTLRRAGLQAPEALSLIGFDDHEMAEVLDLTTIAQPVQEQGERAARLLLGEVAGVGGVQETVVGTRLVVRSTTGPPR